MEYLLWLIGATGKPSAIIYDRTCEHSIWCPSHSLFKQFEHDLFLFIDTLKNIAFTMHLMGWEQKLTWSSPTFKWTKLVTVWEDFLLELNERNKNVGYFRLSPYYEGVSIGESEMMESMELCVLMLRREGNKQNACMLKQQTTIVVVE